MPIKKFYILLSTFYFLFPFMALAVDAGLTNTVPDIATAQAAGGTSGERVASWVQNFYQFSIIAGVFLAVGVITWAGLRYALAAGNPSTQSDARDQILNAIYGLILLFGAYLVLFAINPNLVNLRLQTLKTVSAPNASQRVYSSYQTQDLQRVGEQIKQTYQRDNNAQIDIPIRTGSDQEQQNVSAQCSVNTGGTKGTAVKGIRPGVYVCK